MGERLALSVLNVCVGSKVDKPNVKAARPLHST